VNALELPHTRNCLVCGRANPHGLHLSLHVSEPGVVTTAFTPGAHHIGFEDITHGGVLATVLDEAMVWAATWSYKKFCLCAELSVRFKLPSRVGQSLFIRAVVDLSRPRLTTTSATIQDAENRLIAEGFAKYIPLSSEANRSIVATLVDEPSTQTSASVLRAACVK
jgi:acyl-coenzyme A thioesterase PaaI-like protein